MLGRDLGVKFQRGSRNPTSVILSSGHQTGHFVSNTLWGREISGKIKRLQRSKNHKNHISSDKLPSGMAKTGFGVVCGKEHTFLSGAEALPFDIQIPRLRHVLCSHTCAKHCPGLSVPPLMHQEQDWAGWTVSSPCLHLATRSSKTPSGA